MNQQIPGIHIYTWGALNLMQCKASPWSTGSKSQGSCFKYIDYLAAFLLALVGVNLIAEMYEV